MFPQCRLTGLNVTAEAFLIGNTISVLTAADWMIISEGAMKHGQHRWWRWWRRETSFKTKTNTLSWNFIFEGISLKCCERESRFMMRPQRSKVTSAFWHSWQEVRRTEEDYKLRMTTGWWRLHTEGDWWRLQTDKDWRRLQTDEDWWRRQTDEDRYIFPVSCVVPVWLN